MGNVNPAIYSRMCECDFLKTHTYTQFYIVFLMLRLLTALWLGLCFVQNSNSFSVIVSECAVFKNNSVECFARAMLIISERI